LSNTDFFSSAVNFAFLTIEGGVTIATGLLDLEVVAMMRKWDSSDLE
jgi:hypothetical protein